MEEVKKPELGSQLEIALATKYSLFQRGADNYSYDVYGLQCGPGWLSLLLEFAEKTEELDAKVRLHQIKEKFNRLRIYYEALPHAAEWLSAKTQH
ncbi:MAG: hypothetical protein V7739_18840 [Motiliproteus sp.]